MVTDILKDKIVQEIVLMSTNEASIVIESKSFKKKIDVLNEDLEEILTDLMNRGLISKIGVGDMAEESAYYFSVYYKLKDFLDQGGYSEITLSDRKRKQQLRDLDEANIRSADAAEASALASIRSANEARWSKYISILALIISAIAVLVTYMKS